MSSGLVAVRENEPTLASCHCVCNSSSSATEGEIGLCHSGWYLYFSAQDSPLECRQEL